MENRAEVYNPYRVDMFTTLETGTRVTFTDQTAPAGYYKIIPDNSDQILLIHATREFDAHFKYYTQAKLF